MFRLTAETENGGADEAEAVLVLDGKVDICACSGVREKKGEQGEVGEVAGAEQGVLDQGVALGGGKARLGREQGVQILRGGIQRVEVGLGCECRGQRRHGLLAVRGSDNGCPWERRLGSAMDTSDGDDGGRDERSESGSVSADTDTEITQHAKSRKTLKRKRRATSPARFGAALETLLETAAPDGVAAPLSLKPGVARRHKEEKLERGARKVLDGERKEREEKGRVRDVIGGWGVEGERALRKVAQRGGANSTRRVHTDTLTGGAVITLFNAIQQSQTAAEEATVAARGVRGTGKATLPAPDPERNDKHKKARVVDGASGLCRDYVVLMILRCGGIPGYDSGGGRGGEDVIGAGFVIMYDRGNEMS